MVVKENLDNAVIYSLYQLQMYFTIILGFELNLRTAFVAVCKYTPNLSDSVYKYTDSIPNGTRLRQRGGPQQTKASV